MQTQHKLITNTPLLKKNLSGFIFALYSLNTVPKERTNLKKQLQVIKWNNKY